LKFTMLGAALGRVRRVQARELPLVQHDSGRAEASICRPSVATKVQLKPIYASVRRSLGEAVATQTTLQWLPVLTPRHISGIESPNSILVTCRAPVHSM
jgi:hypothetical protein